MPLESERGWRGKYTGSVQLNGPAAILIEQWVLQFLGSDEQVAGEFPQPAPTRDNPARAQSPLAPGAADPGATTRALVQPPPHAQPHQAAGEEKGGGGFGGVA